MPQTKRELDAAASGGETAIPCPVCHGVVFDVLLNPAEVEDERRWLQEFHRARTKGDLKELAEFTQGEPTHIVACRDCGTVLRNPRPTPKELARRYQNDEYGFDTLEELLDNEREFFRGKAAEIDLPHGSRIVEVGSFVGAFLLAAADRGWQASGLDIGEETLAFQRSKGLKVENAELGDIEGELDAVFVWNTFDQLPEPQTFLAAAADKLKRGGLLVLRVPNGIFEKLALEQRCGPRREKVMIAQAYNNFLTFPYLAGYTPGSLRRLLAQHGFEIDLIEGDTILPLSNSSTRDWAQREEELYKRATLRACKLDRHDTACPWIDCHAHKK